MLTVHLGIVLFNDQLDTQFFFVYVYFNSICFEHSSAHHQKIQVYQYYIWYMSLYVGDRLVCRFKRSVQTWYAGLDVRSKPAYQTVTYIE